jgi:hypothetical protein
VASAITAGIRRPSLIRRVGVRLRQYPQMADGPRIRLLIATGQAAGDVDDLPPLVRTLIARATDILVMTPLLTSALEWYSDDFARARHEADERLGTVLGHVQAIAGVEASGTVGDEGPLAAFEDAIAAFRPDHILVALRAADHRGWQERRLVDRVLARFHVPMTVFQLDRAGRTVR